ncbi:50S ribosomal protein L3 [Candidatus Uhrbacteria bacterium]|nr:50S ribosomal protein L3 [Candidatus Uhrbacteria bacterium]
MKFIIGRKREMTQIFKEDGTVVPVTLIEAGPAKVTDIKTMERDGYSSVQLGFGNRSEKNVAKAQRGQWKDMGLFEAVREFRTDEIGGLEIGATIDATTFEVGDIVDVTGVSKGKGFQGVVKRHGFHGQMKTHGTKDQLRMPGSIGATGPQRVFKGQRMPGRMGGERVTVKNLEVVEIRPQENIIAFKGAVPGSRNGLVLIQTAKQ